MSDSTVIVVTGAGKGIGKAVVQEILERKQEWKKPQLIITARTSSDLLALQSEAQKSGVTCEALPLELANDPAAPIRLAKEKFGRVDILIHSAGVGRFKPFLELTQDDLEFTMKTNSTASFLLMQEAYRLMQKQKNGHIVFITSVAADTPFKESAVYCMSKYAQQGLLDVMRIYAREDGIKLTEVKPGAVYTPMWGEVPKSMSEKMMTPQEVAQAIVDTTLIPGNTTVEVLTLRPVSGDLT